MSLQSTYFFRTSFKFFWLHGFITSWLLMTDGIIVLLDLFSSFGFESHLMVTPKPSTELIVGPLNKAKQNMQNLITKFHKIPHYIPAYLRRETRHHMTAALFYIQKLWFIWVVRMLLVKNVYFEQDFKMFIPFLYEVWIVSFIYLLQTLVAHCRLLWIFTFTLIQICCFMTMT